jgi:hypothetical protein
MHQTYRLMTPEVVSDVIEGEAVIMNLKTGRYFNSEGTGSECWEALASGLAVAQIVDQLAAKYAADRTTIASAVEKFVEELVSQQLIARIDTPPPAVAAPAPDSPLAPFHAPVLNVYSDMQDLLLLDPIHDVDTAGWPMPKSETAA